MNRNDRAVIIRALFTHLGVHANRPPGETSPREIRATLDALRLLREQQGLKPMSNSDMLIHALEKRLPE